MSFPAAHQSNLWQQQVGGDLYSCSLTHWHAGQGSGHMGLAAGSEAPELEVRWGLWWVQHLAVILTLVLLFTRVSFTLLSH